MALTWKIAASSLLFLVMSAALYDVSVLVFQKPTTKSPVPTYIAKTTNNVSTDFPIDKMCKAMWDADFKIMSLIFKQRLNNIIQQNLEGDNNSSGFTIFVPIDGAVRTFDTGSFRSRISLEYQVAKSKVYRHDFDNRLTSQVEQVLGFEHEEQNGFFNSCHNNKRLLVSDVPSEKAKINNVKIIRWNIYDDGQFVIHGVSDFFNIHWTPCFDNYYHPF